MNKPIAALSAGIAGAGLMFFLDPRFGRRRRALLVDKGTRFSKMLGRGVGSAACEVSQFVQGVVAKGGKETRWSPATRAFAITAGVGTVLFGISQRNRAGVLTAGAGASFLTRAITNKPAKRLVSFWKKAS